MCEGLPLTREETMKVDHIEFRSTNVMLCTELYAERQRPLAGQAL